MQQNRRNRNEQASVGARLAAARADAVLAEGRFPENGGSSMADMAQRDLDAALQLLADRAQYITGATGAAIALRRDGRNDMLCRASTGSNAPELGALLSTEAGLSGESVRTKQLLRCDDAERDARVNREVCRRMGIASVVVMPVVNDDEVLGVLELFSGRANAFGERDLAAVRRLSEMVETAVRLAQAAVKLPEQLRKTETVAAEAPKPVASQETGEDAEDILDREILAQPVPQVAKSAGVETRVRAESGMAKAVPVPVVPPDPAGAIQKEAVAKPDASSAGAEGSNAAVSAPAQAATVLPAKKLFWSAAASADGETNTEKDAEADQSHIPPVLRLLRKCEACGFPITAGRVLCVECEEKKWRGQLKRPADQGAGAAKNAAPAFKAEGQTVAVTRDIAKWSATQNASASATAVPKPIASRAVGSGKAEVKSQAVSDAKGSGGVLAAETAVKAEDQAVPTFAFSGGIESSQSWLSANKYVLIVLLVIAAIVAALFFR